MKKTVRKWLNKVTHHSTGFIYTHIETSKDSQNVNASVKIADCDRVITIDFDCWDWRKAQYVKDFNNSLRKLDILIDTLIQFREDYVAAFEEKVQKFDE